MKLENEAHCSWGLVKPLVRDRTYILKCFWNTDWLLHFAEMWKPCKSNHHWRNHFSAPLHIFSPWNIDSVMAYFIPKHHKSTRVPYVYMKHDSWAAGELCNEERAHNADLPIPCTTPVVNEACCTYSDFVNWISAFPCKTNLCWSVTPDMQLSDKGLKMRKKRLDEDASARHGRRESETTRAEEWETGAVELMGSAERWKEGFDLTNEKSSADREPKRPLWEAKHVVEGEDRTAQLGSAACYSRCHLFQLLLISAWTYLLGRKLNIDLFFYLHSKPHPLFF